MIKYLQHYLFIEDLDPKPVVDLLSKTFSYIQIEHLRQHEEIFERLQSRSPENTIVLLNAHIRFNSGDLRSNFLGMRFLRRELRTKWRRREAVVVYSPLSQEAFLNIPVNRILYVGPGHYYCQMINPNSIINIVEQAKPIETDDDLDEIIQGYGCLGGLIRTAKHDLRHLLSVVDSEEYPTTHYNVADQIDRLVQEIVALVPERFHQEFQIERLRKETSQLVCEIQNDGETQPKINTDRIRSILATYYNLSEQFFKV